MRISFEVSGFQTKTHLLQRDFIFFNLFELQTFCVFKMQHSKPHHQFSTLSDFIYYFSCIYWFFWAKWPWNWKALQMNSKKVETWHGIIISPTLHVIKSWEGYGKNWIPFVYKTGQSLSKYQGFVRKLIYCKGISFFLLIWTPEFLCVQNAPLKGTSSIFDPFWLHLLFLMHLLIFLS